MFEFLTPNPAVDLLKDDHDRIKALFDRFEEAKGRAAKLKIVREALAELKVHAAVEEEIFYPYRPEGGGQGGDERGRRGAPRRQAPESPSWTGWTGLRVTSTPSSPCWPRSSA